MSMFGILVLCIVAVAPSYQIPVETENANLSDKKANATGTSDSMAPKDNGRTFGFNKPQPVYYNYPGWPYPAQQVQPMQLRSDMVDSSRTLHRPSFYSQGYVAPQVVPVQAYQYPAYESYQSPYVSGLNHGYSYGGYQSYYKNGEDDKPRQFLNFMPTDKYISPAHTGAQYETRYLLDNPSAVSNLQGYYQPQLSHQVASASVFRDAAEDKMPQMNYYNYPSYPRSAITIDDKLQLQIPNDYLVNRLQHLTPADLITAEQAVSRASEESQPMVWSHPMASPKAGIDQAYLGPYVSQNDAVVMVPLDENNPAKGYRSAVYEMPTYPNYEQQLRMGKMQYYTNDMNNAAYQNELIANKYADTKEQMQQLPIPASRSGQVTPEEMAQLQYIIQKMTGYATETAKVEKNDQNAAAKSNETAAPKTKA